MSQIESEQPNGRGMSGATATARTMGVLAAFAGKSEWGVRELAAQQSLPRTSVHRVLQELADEGFLRLTDTGAYRVMPALLRFALDLAENFRVPRVAQAHLEHARDECGETTVLLLYDRGRRQVAGVAAAESIRAVRFAAEAARDFSDIYLGARGKGVLAFLPKTEQERILAGFPDPLPGPLPTSKAALRKELASISRRGWAHSSGEATANAEGACAPVYGSAGEVIGGLLIAWPQRNGATSLDVEVGLLAVRTARAISLDVGCPADALPPSEEN